MLYEFVTARREAIIARASIKGRSRPGSPPSPGELRDGLSIFLAQLSDTLLRQGSGAWLTDGAIGDSATRHGRELLGLGFTVSEVVHDYGDICQSITEIAVEEKVPITADEFRILNHCLDVAIADAVTEHARMTAESWSTQELERTGRTVHEIRNLLNAALLAFAAVRRGTVGVNSNTGAVLGRSLTGLRALVDSTLSDVRTAASHHRPEVLSVSVFLKEIVAGAHLQAEYAHVQFVAEQIEPHLYVNVDQQLLASAVTNLLSNAFKYTREGGRVFLRAAARGGQVAIEVEDSCGGILTDTEALFQPFAERRARDRSGLGLGLSIARRAVRTEGGDIRVHNMPGHGCVFVIEVPAAAPADIPAIAQEVSAEHTSSV